MNEPGHISILMRQAFAAIVANHVPGGVLLGEYVVVSSDDWDDFRSIVRSRGFEVEYSVEAAEGGGIEYHVHSHLEEAEDILWAIQALNVIGACAEHPEPAFAQVSIKE